MTEIDEQAFNRFCAEVMGYKISSQCSEFAVLARPKEKSGYIVYRPFNDLNQLAEVADKLMKNKVDAMPMYSANEIPKDAAALIINPYYGGIKQAFRSFVWSCHE